MKIYNDVLQPDTISAICEETRCSHSQATWTLSTLAWERNIQEGAMAATACKPASEALARTLEEEVKGLLPPHQELRFLIYVWPRGSSISCHNDAHCKFGATIYLNNEWPINNGGLFVWQENDSDEWKARVPKYNTMVLNDERELHLVTPVSYSSMDMRHTVQIWGL